MGENGLSVRIDRTRRLVTGVASRPGCGDCPRSFGADGVGGTGSSVRIDRTRRLVTGVARRSGCGDCPRSFGAGGVGGTGLSVRIDKTRRLVTGVARRPGCGDCPRSFGAGGVGGTGSSVRIDRTRRLVTGVARRPGCGDCPRSFGAGGVCVGLDRPSESTEPEDWLQALQGDSAAAKYRRVSLNLTVRVSGPSPLPLRLPYLRTLHQTANRPGIADDRRDRHQLELFD